MNATLFCVATGQIVFILSPGYALLPEPLQFVSPMVISLAEMVDVVIPAPNRQDDPNRYYPFRSEHPAVWSKKPSAIQGFKDQSTRVVLDEVLGLELLNFGRLLKLRPGENAEVVLENGR